MGVYEKKVEPINDFLFLDTNKPNKIKIGMTEMRMDDSEMSMKRKKKQAWSIKQSWEEL